MRTGSLLPCLLVMAAACDAGHPTDDMDPADAGADAAAMADSATAPVRDLAATEVPWAVTDFPTFNQDAIPNARLELGRLLFYDPLLSADGQTACGTCHSEFWGMGDGLARSVGLGAGLLSGPGREGPNVLRRNAPALWNMAFRESLFWDGRATSLEEQALEPLFAADELARPPEAVAGDLAELPAYLKLFEEAFEDRPAATVANMARALADFQRALVSRRSLYDSYLEGDRGALSDDLVEGMLRFAQFGCHDCHTPPLFESERFADRAVQPVEGLSDLGRQEVTGDPMDRHHFRVPSLRNVAFAEPYFHNGTTMNLGEAVHHELDQQDQEYDELDVALVTAFISQALRDESREPQRPDETPSGLPIPRDGTQLRR